MLCKTCESTFEGPIPATRSSSGSTVWHNHHADEEVIRSSANAGCQICVPLWQEIEFTNSKCNGPDPQYPELFTLYAIQPAGGSLEKTISQDSTFVLLIRISARKWTWDNCLEFHIVPDKHSSQTATSVSTHNLVTQDPPDLSSNLNSESGFP